MKRINQYVLVRRIGASSRAVVYCAFDSDRQLQFAVKVIPTGGSQTDSLLLQKEIRVMRRLNHPNILRLREVLHSRRLATAYLVFEYATYGSLATWVGASLPEPALASIFKQICCAMSFLHSHGYVHNRIKPSNILLVSESLAKLSDLGAGQPDGESNAPPQASPYRAPEFLEASDSIVDPVKEAVWGVGVTLFEVAFGRVPFADGTVLTVPATASQNLADLLQRMLNCNPAGRCSLDEVIAHPFIDRADNTFALPEMPTNRQEENVSAPLAIINANVCDDDYTFMSSQRSVSCAAILGPFN
jgi:serine/threonine protein kinase